MKRNGIDEGKYIKINNDTINTYANSYRTIASSNQTITVLDTSSGNITGFIVDAGVTPITLNLKNGNYVVPNGKIFVLFGTNDYGYAKPTFSINGILHNQNTSSSTAPLLFSSGTTLSCKCYINGYLK